VRRAAFTICVAIGVLAVPGSALAGPPSATTGAATAVTGTTATLSGTVLANKEETTYHFEWGTTTAYGLRSPDGMASGNAGKTVAADVTGLTPLTTYHFRLVASNASGTAFGADAQFTTTTGGPPPQPAVTIAAKPRVVTFGKPVTITGQVPGRPSEKVELEENPFPFNDPFRNAAQGTTDSAANYSFTVTPPLNTQYHVVAKSPTATSADVTVLVRTKVGLRLSDRTPVAGARVRFRGSVFPAHDGSEVRIQRRTSSGWKTIATPVLRTATPLNGVERSKYRRRLRVRRSGVFRTVMPAHADHARGKSGKRRAVVH
jgi:hypothetical protein